jgi:hypothetical protein
MTIDAHDLIASKMIGYRGKLGIPDTTPCVFGSGPILPAAVILGGNPDGSSVSAKSPFYGLAGQMLTGMMTAAGLERESFWLTYAIKLQPTMGGAGRAAELREAAWPFLKKELKVIGRTAEGGSTVSAIPGTIENATVAQWSTTSPCRLMLVMGQTPALMLWPGRATLPLASGTIRPAKIGKQVWTCLVTTDISEASSGRVKAAMADDFRTLAGLISGAIKPDLGSIPDAARPPQPGPRFA